MKEQLEYIFSFFKEYANAAEALLVVGLTLVFAIIQAFVFKKVHPRLKLKERLWEDAILSALYKPLQWFIWIVGLTFALDILANYSESAYIFRVIGPVRKALIVVVLVWFLLNFIKQLERVLMTAGTRKRKVNKTTVRAIGQMLKVIVIVTSAFVVLQTTLGIGASAVIAFAGGGSITIGIAAKDMLSNFFGGLMIYLDRPFSIGDRIKSTDGKTDGVVEEIGWRLTRIMTLEKVPMYVPNAYFLNTSIENPSRMSHRRIRTHFGVRYEDFNRIPVIVKEVESMLKSHEGIDQKSLSLARLTTFAPSSLDFLVMAYTKTIDYDAFTEIQQDILFKIMNIIEKHGASCAFPTTTVHIPDGIDMIGSKA